MVALYSLAVSCFFVLFGAAIAACRHVLRAELKRERSREGHPHEASPRPASHPDGSWQRVQDLAPGKQLDWGFLVPLHKRVRRFAQEDHSDVRLPRKAPQAASFGRSERLDWMYFNKDLGDLNDPYEPRKTAGGGARPFGQRP